jgi:hypothetical protein
MFGFITKRESVFSAVPIEYLNINKLLVFESLVLFSLHIEQVLCFEALFINPTDARNYKITGTLKQLKFRQLLLSCGVLPLVLKWIYFGFRFLDLHILLNHNAAMVLSSFSLVFL